MERTTLALLVLQQLLLKQTPRKILKVLQSNTFKIFLGFRASRCRFTD
jgi:hypothetical protein